MLEIKRQDLFNPEVRRSEAEASFYRFGEISTQHSIENPQSSNLRAEIFDIASHGIWGELNSMNPNFENHISESKPIVFTGQQPTLDYGIYRRLAKRSGQHKEITTVHTHADHDRAGKNGFAEVQIPTVSSEGLSLTTYKIGIEFNENQIMSDVRPPTFNEITGFFEKLTSDVSLSREHLQSTNIHPDTALLENARQFILERHNQIRSLAEFNAILQTFIIRKISPDTDTVDIMLSDLLKSSVVRKAMAEQILEIPSWLPNYNRSTEYARKIPELSSNALPKQPLELDHKDAKLQEIPYWILDSSVGNSRIRDKAWLRVHTNCDGIEIYQLGKYSLETGQFDTLVEFMSYSSVEDILNHPNFQKISPAAVTLVDLLRRKLKLPLIHGKTGYIYESVNELTAFKEDQDEDNDQQVKSISLEGLAPIAAISHEQKPRGAIKSLLKIGKEALEPRREKAQVQLRELNLQLKESHESLNQEMDTDLEKLGLKDIKRITQIPEGHKLNRLNSELGGLILTINGLNNPDLHYDPNTLKRVNILFETLFEISLRLGKSEFEYLLEAKGFQAISSFWNGVRNWEVARIKHFELTIQKNEAERNLAYIVSQERILIEQEKADTPLIQAAIYHPRAIRAIPRLQRRKLYSDSLGHY